MDNGPANLGYGDIQVFCGGASVDSITCNPVSPNVNRNFLMALMLKSENQTNDVDNYYVSYCLFKYNIIMLPNE